MNILQSPLIRWTNAIQKAIFGKEERNISEIGEELKNALEGKINHKPKYERIFYSFLSVSLAGKKVNIPKKFSTIEGYKAYLLADGVSNIGREKTIKINDILNDISPMHKCINLALKNFGNLKVEEIEKLFEMQKNERIDPYLRVNLSWLLALGGYNSEYSNFSSLLSSPSSFVRDTLALYLVFSTLSRSEKVEVLLHILEREKHPYVIETSLMALGACKYKRLPEIVAKKVREIRHKSVYTGGVLALILANKKITNEIVSTCIDGAEWVLGVAQKHGLLSNKPCYETPEYCWGEVIGEINHKKSSNLVDPLISMDIAFPEFAEVIIAFLPLLLYGILDSWWWDFFIFQFSKNFKTLEKLAD